MKWRLWINRITTGLLILIVAIMMAFVISSKVSGGAPKIFGYEMMTVLSGSMEPKIHTGSVIAVQPTKDVTHFKVGDVITFRAQDDNNILITHRIKEVQQINGGGVQYITQGDANDSQDPKPVAASRVVGEYANFTIPLLGYILAFAKSKAGLVTLVIIPGALLIVWQMISLWTAILKSEKEKALQAHSGGQEPTQSA